MVVVDAINTFLTFTHVLLWRSCLLYDKIQESSLNINVAEQYKMLLKQAIGTKSSDLVWNAQV